MVSVSAGDDIDRAHFKSLTDQLVDKWALVYGQEVESLKDDWTYVNDFFMERIAIDVSSFYYATQIGSLSYRQCYDTIYSSSSNLNDGNDGSNPEVFGQLIRHEDINQSQNGIDLAHLAGPPDYSNFAIDGRWRSQTADIAANDDAAKIYSSLLVTWDTGTSFTVTSDYSGGTTVIDGNNQNKIRYMTQCGGRITIFGEGLNSSGSSKDNDVKNMIDSISYIHNPWPLTNIQLSDNWGAYTVLQTVNSASNAYSDNALQLVCRRNSNNEILYALRYTDASDGSGSGNAYSEASYDEAVTTDFKLTVNAYYPSHLQNDWRPDVQVGD